MPPTKPILVVAHSISDFNAWVKEEGGTRTSSRLPVMATVGRAEHYFAELNRRADWLKTRNFSKVLFVKCDMEQAFAWFKALINARVQSPTSETVGQPIKKRKK